MTFTDPTPPRRRGLLSRIVSRPSACPCGHARDAHRHHRNGTDCALCPCPSFGARSRRTTRPERTREA